MPLPFLTSLRWIAFSLAAAAGAGGIWWRIIDHAALAAPMGPASPIYGVTIPDGYRSWELVGPSLEAAPLNELRVIVGNKVAINAYKSGKLPFPNGSILVKLAWKRAQSPDFAPATIPAAATTVQVMVKDSRRYAASGGWGYGRFANGIPAPEAQQATCFACHSGHVRERDYVFTHYAP
ncbi:cytochrome P460 family protein [Acetobacter sacchari]|uniref:Cytochrome P460 family protein n=1 Tax=Acetobacter sacchari TaxID=2661687 RepID=A0ABS3LX79_9PROT|nr:cytochrome P460 family protein [Acetobacter sacchari]MBO1360466.1 cytochrome P460 family protein [Acetobacter sacchari]